MRKSQISRKTAETDISLALTLDGVGVSSVDTGCGFLNHMLILFARHGRMDLSVKCVGDKDVDFHHTTEDIGIVLGKAFAEALGDKKGITRYGSTTLPMDETLILTAVDVSGRSHLTFDVEMPSPKVGSFDTELCKEFWLACVRSAGITLHIHEFCGENSHHIIEAIFKSAARSLKAAASIDSAFADEVPSTKGVL